MRIRITSPPRGEAPADVRAAWVGLSLPTTSELIERRCVGVVSWWQPGFLGWIRRLIRGKRVERGYLVDASEAVRLLAASNPDAAAWWRENTPYLLEPGQQFLFYQERCGVDAEPTAG